MHCAKCFFYEGGVGDDLCARCGRAFLPEANVYLGLLLLVTGGMAWTLRNLLTGSADPLVRPAFGLGAWGTWPVSVVHHPAYGFVIGAWLAMLAAAPILTGILYGKRGGWLLCIFMAMLGPSLALAGAAALGVWIAGGHTLRLGSRLAGGLLALVPSAAYWFVQTARVDLDEVERELGRALLAPALRSMMYVPALVAVGVAAAAVALVVAIGQADRWHVRWPGALLTVLVVGPALALLAFVGVDRIRYEMLPRVGHVPLARLIGEHVEFLRRHPGGPVAAQVRADLALALEEAIARGEHGLPSTPSPQYLWNQLVEEHPGSSWAVDARLHLADSSAAAGLFDEAGRCYVEVLQRTAGVEVPDSDPMADFTLVADLFTVGEEIAVKETARRLQAVRHRALLNYGLLRDNRAGDEPADRALALYFAALATKGTNRYREALLKAREADAQGRLADNVAFDLAHLEADELRRIELLTEAAAAHPGTDGAVRALLAAADGLTARAPGDPASLPAALDLLLQVQSDLDARRRIAPDDPYVLALGDLVQKKIAYVQVQLRTPEK